MSYPSIILAILGLAAAGGAATAWWKRSEGTNTIDLLKTNIQSYQISEQQHLTEIETLKALINEKDNIITEQNKTIKRVVKEFKEYKNDG